MLNVTLHEISHSHSLRIPTALLISHLDLVMQINLPFYSFFTQHDSIFGQYGL